MLQEYLSRFLEWDFFLVPQKVFILLVLLLAAFYPALRLFKKIVNLALQRLSFTPTGITYSTLAQEAKLNRALIHLFIALYLISITTVLKNAGIMYLLGPYWQNSATILAIWQIVLPIYLRLCLGLLAISLISLALKIYEQRISHRKYTSLGLPMHILKMLVQIITFISILVLLLGSSLNDLLARIAAFSALLIYIFQDFLRGILASIQLTMQNILRVGDWITIPKYHVDGVVENITTTVIKVRNFDNTSISFPTHAATVESIQNWRAMQTSGGRRIKRSLLINLDSVQFLDEQSIKKFLTNPLLTSFAKEYVSAIHSKEAISNLSIFRHYVNFYLKKRKDIHTNQHTFLVRQLEPTQYGVPLELYIFTTTTNWVAYENIQSEIFEHLFCMITHFSLRLFQRSYKEK